MLHVFHFGVHSKLIVLSVNCRHFWSVSRMSSSLSSSQRMERRGPTGASAEKGNSQSELSTSSSESTGAANFPLSATPFTTTSSVRPRGNRTNNDQSSRFDNISRPSSSIQHEGPSTSAAASKWSDGGAGGGSEPSHLVGPTNSSSVFNLLFTPGSSTTANESRVDTSQRVFALPSGRAPRSCLKVSRPSTVAQPPTPASTHLFKALNNAAPRLAAPYFSPLPVAQQQQQSPHLFANSTAASPYANSLPPSATPGPHRGPPVITPRLTAGAGGRLTVGGTPSVSATPRTGQSRPRRDDNVIVGKYFCYSFEF